jgi:UDP-N-acetylglucosamine--N-acetylmuramyl-(pentapeptide) pyrophosphoryl-undecaprenol N-acetylglucosamine transferase
MRKVKILFCAGGTGGHIMPLLAVADRIKESCSTEAEIAFVMGNRAIDRSLAMNLPYSVVHLPLNKGIEGFSSAVKLAFKIFSSISLSLFRLVASCQAVVTSGSYVSLLPSICAFAMRRPVYLIEPNAYPGRFTRLLGKLCRRVFGGWHILKKYLGERNLDVVGIPLRKGFSNAPTKNEARRILGIPQNSTVLFVLGGSQGAEALNRFILENQRLIKYGVPNIYIIHIAGDKECVKEIRQAYKEAGVASSVFDWWDDVWTLYAASDVVLARSGALTCAEIMKMKRPALIVPHPSCADQHQLLNAMEIGREGVATVVEQKNLKDRGLGALITLLINHDVRRKMEEAFEKTDSLTNAEKKIAEKILREILEESRDGKVSQVVVNRCARTAVFGCRAS